MGEGTKPLSLRRWQFRDMTRLARSYLMPTCGRRLTGIWGSGRDDRGSESRQMVVGCQPFAGHVPGAGRLRLADQVVEERITEFVD